MLCCLPPLPMLRTAVLPLQVLEVFDKVRSEFPGAEVLATPLDDFVTPLLEAAPQLNLPVVSGLLHVLHLQNVAFSPLDGSVTPILEAAPNLDLPVMSGSCTQQCSSALKRVRTSGSVSLCNAG